MPIKRLTMDEANVGLGFRLAPSGCLHSDIQHRKIMSDTMEAKVNAARLTPSEASTFYRAIYEPKIYYPSKVTAFRGRDWKYITKKS